MKLKLIMITLETQTVNICTRLKLKFKMRNPNKEKINYSSRIILGIKNRRNITHQVLSLLIGEESRRMLVLCHQDQVLKEAVIIICKNLKDLLLINLPKKPSIDCIKALVKMRSHRMKTKTVQSQRRS